VAIWVGGQPELFTWCALCVGGNTHSVLIAISVFNLSLVPDNNMSAACCPQHDFVERLCGMRLRLATQLFRDIMLVHHCD
jgi:hypothetical protein